MRMTEEQIERLEKCLKDDEAYHAEFDAMLEERLMELDPEWMSEMQARYADSGMSRWYV